MQFTLITHAALLLALTLAWSTGCRSAGSGNSNANSNANDNGGLSSTYLLESSGIAVEADSRAALRVFLRDPTGNSWPLTVPLSETGSTTARLIVAGQEVADFAGQAVRREPVTGLLGLGERLTLTTASQSQPIIRKLILEAAQDHPGVILARSIYIADEDITVDTFIEHDLELVALDVEPFAKAADLARRRVLAGDDPLFWSFQGGAQQWGEDYVLPITESFSRRNEQPLLGGVPYCDIYSRGGGLGIGSASTVPKRRAIPVEASGDSVRISLEWSGQTLSAGQEVEVGQTLLVAHTGDFFGGIRKYAAAMAALGVAPPGSFSPEAYLQHWETYGYEEDWTVEDITSRLDYLPALGIGAVTIDSGWYEDFLTGDYVPDPAKFPNGEQDLLALTGAIHAAGMKVKL